MPVASPALKRQDFTGADFHLIDSFEGFPEPRSEDFITVNRGKNGAVRAPAFQHGMRRLRWSTCDAYCGISRAFISNRGLFRTYCPAFQRHAGRLCISTSICIIQRWKVSSIFILAWSRTVSLSAMTTDQISFPARARRGISTATNTHSLRRTRNGTIGNRQVALPDGRVLPGDIAGRCAPEALRNLV